MLTRLLLMTILLPTFVCAQSLSQSISRYSDLLMLCFQNDSAILLTFPTNKSEIDSFLSNRKPEIAEFFYSENLIKWSHDGFRTGAKVLHRKCGEVSILISSGFPNANPQGAEGVYEFPTVVASYRNRTLIPFTTITKTCVPDTPRWGDCATEYAAAVSVHRSASGDFDVDFQRSDHEN